MPTGVGALSNCVEQEGELRGVLAAGVGERGHRALRKDLGLDQVGRFGGEVGVFDLAQGFGRDDDLVLIELFEVIKVGAFVRGQGDSLVGNAQ